VVRKALSNLAAVFPGSARPKITPRRRSLPKLDLQIFCLGKTLKPKLLQINFPADGATLQRVG
jgi:hypothetical protein